MGCGFHNGSRSGRVHEWRGRYPIPQSVEGMTLVQRPDRSTPMSDYLIAGELFPRLCDLMGIQETAK
jgi:hypothetical protein